MSNNILPNAVSLITMTDDELREELCRDIYNKPNSHEMIRRLARLCVEYAKMADDCKEAMFTYRDAIRSAKSALGDIE